MVKADDSISKLNAIDLRKQNFQARGEVRIIDGCIDASSRIFDASIKSVYYCNTDIRQCKSYIRSVIAGNETYLDKIEDCSHATTVAGIIAAKEGIILSTEFLKKFGLVSESSITTSGLAPTLDKVVSLPMSIHNDAETITEYFRSLTFTESNISDSRGNIVIENFSETVILSSVSGAPDIDFWDIARSYCAKNNFLYVTAVGNNNRNFNELNDNEIKAINSACLPPPSSCPNDLVICVGTYIFDKNGNREIKGNYGNSYVDIVASTDKIYTILPGLNAGYANSSISISTSFAAPQITAAIAYMKTCKPNAQASELRTALLKNSIIDPSIEDKVINGRVFDLISTVKNFCNPSHTENKSNNESLQLSINDRINSFFTLMIVNNSHCYRIGGHNTNDIGIHLSDFYCSVQLTGEMFCESLNTEPLLT